LKARLLVRGHYASGRSCDRPTQSRFSMVSLGPIANVKLLPQIHVAIHASHSTLPTLSKNVVNLSRNQIQPKCSNSYAAYSQQSTSNSYAAYSQQSTSNSYAAYSQQSTSNYPTFYTSQRSYLAYILL